MKKYILPLLAVCLSLTACDDFLSKENPNKIESEFFFKNESSLELYTNGLIRSYATAIMTFINGDRYSDAMSWDGEYLFYTDRYDVSDNTSWSWTSLRSINYYLANMRNADADEATLNHYEGVGRFFRALFYIDKVQTYGSVPWYDHVVESTSEEDLYRARDSRSFVCKMILEDLNYACENCSGDSKFRTRSTLINKYVALAIKARFCLYEGTYRKYHTSDLSDPQGRAWTSEEKAESTTYLNECIKACEEIMNSGVYSLVDDPSKRATQYRQMFIDADGCANYTNEWIWARDYDETLNVANQSYSINDYMTNAQHAQYQFNRDFLFTYLMQDGTPFTDKYPDYYKTTFAEETTGRDLRLTQTIRYPGFKRADGKNYPPSFVYTKTGYQPIKYLQDVINDEINSSTFVDVPLIRYAEILLSYAEAKAEQNACTQEVWDKTIKPLRERAGVTSIYPTKADDYLVKYFNNTITDPVILEVRRERGIELTMENLRQHDIRRWHMGDLLVKVKTGMWISEIEKDLDLDLDGTPDNIVSAALTEKAGLSVLTINYNGSNKSGTGHVLSEGDHGYIMVHTKLQAGYHWSEKKYLSPIPSSDVTLNSDLTQNYGW